MWWPWSFLLKRFHHVEKIDAEGFPKKYEQHGLKEKGRRAQQLHRHDSQSKLCLDDIDERIRRLKKIKIKIKIKSRNGEVCGGCRDKKHEG